MADITNLLAQGFDPLPANIRANALMQGQQLQQNRMRNALLQQQMQQAQEERAAQQRNALMMQEAINAIPSPQMAASQQALAGGGGPTVANAARMPAVDPRLQALHGLMQASGGKLVSPVDYLKEANPRDEFVTLAPGSVRVNARTNQPVFTAPKEQKESPFIEQMRAAGIDPASPEGQGMLRDMLRKQSTHSPAVTVSYGAPQAGVDDKGNPVFFQPSKGGGAPAIVPNVRPAAKEEKPLTEGQAKAVLFSSRMQAADKVMADLARKGFSTTIPGATKNSVLGDVITAASPAEQQQLVQAKRDFVNAVLRRESGAVISPEEFANAERQYFPQIGDSRPVIEQKARNRRAAIEGMRADVPQNRQGEVDRISGGNSALVANDDPLGLRGGK